MFSARPSVPAPKGMHPVAQPSSYTSQDLTLKEESGCLLLSLLIFKEHQLNYRFLHEASLIASTWNWPPPCPTPPECSLLALLLSSLCLELDFYLSLAPYETLSFLKKRTTSYSSFYFLKVCHSNPLPLNQFCDIRKSPSPLWALIYSFIK